ncbi:MAG: vWA domain-containing protein [Saprospiraceae bacterium]
MDHYTDYSSFTAALIGFVQEARSHGFSSGIQCSHDAVATALHGLWWDLEHFEFALAALFCTDKDEREPFRVLFNRFWKPKGSRVRQKTAYKNQKRVFQQQNRIAVMVGTGKSSQGEQEEESKNTSGANAKETLKKTDFAHLTEEQSALLDELAEKLVREMSLRIRRKRKKAKKGTVDMGASIRKNIQNGGALVQLSRLKRKKQRYRLLVLLDVSGSMDKYSFYLLKFLWALKAHFKHIEAFVFSTLLMRITDELSEKNLAAALHNVSLSANHWSGGTQIGACLKTFNEGYAKRFLNGNTLTIVLSDGLDTGEPEVLEEAIQKIKLRSRKLVWLNPLKGMQGYEPIQRGMQAALPALSHFGSAHNFESLLQLENILTDA